MASHILSVDGVLTPKGEAMEVVKDIKAIAQELKATNRLASMALTLAAIKLEHSLRQI